MDRVTHLQRVAARLEELHAAHAARQFPAPATRAAAIDMAERKQKIRALLDRTKALSQRVQALLATAPDDWESTKRDIDRELSEIETQSMSL